MSDRELYYGKFERDGEEAVRNNLALQRYNEKHRGLAQEWLAQRDRAKADAAREVEMDLARRATEAAESAATSARTANQIAREARNISYFAAAVSVAATALVVISLVVGK